MGSFWDWLFSSNKNAVDKTKVNEGQIRHSIKTSRTAKLYRAQKYPAPKQHPEPSNDGYTNLMLNSSSDSYDGGSSDCTDSGSGSDSSSCD